MAEWFIPATEEFRAERALLHLGLNSSLRYYRELVAPGIGGVWFVRQLSWAVAGVYLANELKLKPAKVANAIEALACKLEWLSETDKDNFRRRGKRAFNRDADDNIWKFSELSDRTHYVQVTYRQSTVRALSELKLASGTRFNTMILTGIGNELAAAFLEKKKVHNALSDWLNGDPIHKTPAITEGIGAPWVTPQEKSIVSKVLLGDAPDGLSDPHRRHHLIAAFGANTVNMPDVETIKRNLLQSPLGGLQEQVNDIETSMAFDIMLDSARRVIYVCAELVAEKESPLLTRLVANRRLAKALKDLQKAAAGFQKSPGRRHSIASTFAAEVLSPAISEEKCLEAVVRRDGVILDASNGKVLEGQLFDRRKDSGGEDNASPDEVGAEDLSTNNKIFQLFSLWGDCR